MDQGRLRACNVTLRRPVRYVRTIFGTLRSSVPHNIRVRRLTLRMLKHPKVTTIAESIVFL